MTDYIKKSPNHGKRGKQKTPTITDLAKRLGIAKQTVYKRCKKLNITSKQYLDLHKHLF